MSTYVFDNAREQARQRFTSLEACYDPVTIARLTELGVRPGWRCLEVGAGSGSIANWLADRVAPGGSVVATDIDTRWIGAVRDGVQVLQHDILNDELPEAEFDLVHARLVLLHLPQRELALANIQRAMRPGGLLLLDEFDCTWRPVLAADDDDAAVFGKVIDAMHGLLTAAGADVAWGRHAYRGVREAGFVELGVRGFSEAWTGGSTGCRLDQANLTQVRDKLLDAGLVTEAELDTVFRLSEDPGFAVSSYFMLSTWGRRPG